MWPSKPCQIANGDGKGNINKLAMSNDLKI
jgi:hypothetical protein